MEKSEKRSQQKPSKQDYIGDTQNQDGSHSVYISTKKYLNLLWLTVKLHVHKNPTRGTPPLWRLKELEGEREREGGRERKVAVCVILFDRMTIILRPVPYKGQLFGRDDPYKGQLFGRDDPYKGQLFGRDDPYKGQLFGRDDPYKGQLFGSDDPYKGQLFGRDDPYKGQLVGRDDWSVLSLRLARIQSCPCQKKNGRE